MSQDTLVILQSTGKHSDGKRSKHAYWTKRKKTSKGAQNKDVLEVKKYDPTLKKRVLYKQVKKLS